MTELIVIFVGTVFVNNFVLVRFLGLCPFLGVSQNLEAAAGMSLATAFVLTLSSATAYLLHEYVLVPLNLEYLRTLSFILVIAASVQFTEIMVRRLSPLLHHDFCELSVADDARSFLGEENWCWDNASTPLLATTISAFTPLLTRVELDQVHNMVEQSKQS